MSKKRNFRNAKLPFDKEDWSEFRKNWENLSRQEKLEWLINNGQLEKYSTKITLKDLWDYVDRVAGAKFAVCPVCEKKLSNYNFAITYRTVYWLKGLQFLINQDKGVKNTFYFPYYKINYMANKIFQSHFNLSGYGRLSHNPYNFIVGEYDEEGNQKRNGKFTITKRGIDFLNGKISVPNKVQYIVRQYDKYIILEDTKEITVYKVPKLDFKTMLDRFDTYS